MADTVTVRDFFKGTFRSRTLGIKCKLSRIREGRGSTGKRRMESLHNSAPTYYRVTWFIFASLTKQASVQTFRAWKEISHGQLGLPSVTMPQSEARASSGVGVLWSGCQHHPTVFLEWRKKDGVLEK